MASRYGQKQIFSKVKGAGQATITIEDIRGFEIDKVNECYTSLGSEFLNYIAKVRELKENMEV